MAYCKASEAAFLVVSGIIHIGLSPQQVNKVWNAKKHKFQELKQLSHKVKFS